MSILRSLKAALILIGLFGAGAASASCAAGGTCSCSISITSLAFGAYDTQSPSPTDTVGTLSISCSSSDPANSTLSVSLSPGNSSDLNARKMLSGTHPLYYNLYTNVARTTVWGDGSGGGDAVTSSFPASSRGSVKLSIYGRIPAQQNAYVGVYHDSVTVTVTY